MKAHTSDVRARRLRRDGSWRCSCWRPAAQRRRRRRPHPLRGPPPRRRLGACSRRSRRPRLPPGVEQGAPTLQGAARGGGTFRWRRRQGPGQGLPHRRLDRGAGRAALAAAAALRRRRQVPRRPGRRRQGRRGRAAAAGPVSRPGLRARSRRSRDGIVTLQVLEGRIGAVKLERRARRARSPPEYLDRHRGASCAATRWRERELVERALFTLGDLRGISVSTSLTPGDKIGQADLTIKVAPGAGLWRQRSTSTTAARSSPGRYRINAGFDWFNPTGRGDVASLRAQVSTNLGSQVPARLVADADQLDRHRARLRGELPEVRARHGHLRAARCRRHGRRVFAAAAAPAGPLAQQQPVPAGEHRLPRASRTASTPSARDQEGHRVRTSTLGVVGDFRDTFAGGGITNYTARTRSAAA